MLCKKCKKDIPVNSQFCNYCGCNQKENKKSKKSRGNGQGSVYKLPSGKWCAEITKGYIPVESDKENEQPKKKRLKKRKYGFKTKKDALDYLTKMQSDNMSVKKIKMSQIYDVWSKTHFTTISKSAQSTYKTAYKKISTLQNNYISDIRLADMQSIVDETEGGYYPKRDIKLLLNHLYRYAMIEDYCSKNYAQYIKLPPLEKPKKDAFTAEERKLIWEDYEKGNEFTGYILIMIYTGMRYGEISTILLSNISLDKKYIIGGIKSEAGKNRKIPIKDKILPIVEIFYNKGKVKLLEIPEKDFYIKFKSSLERAAVRQLSPHCCRHTLATMMAEAGVQPAIIKATAGHKNYSTTIGYTHISLDEQLSAINNID